MPLLQVRDFPKAVYDKIVNLAKDDRRTVPQETIVLIERGIKHMEDSDNSVKIALDKARRRKVLDEIEKDPLVIHGDYPDIAQLFREDRDR
jgi:hypothetical protein